VVGTDGKRVPGTGDAAFYDRWFSIISIHIRPILKLGRGVHILLPRFGTPAGDLQAVKTA
jgi:hypothetical protein